MPDSLNKNIKVLVVAPALPMIGGQVVQASRLIENFRSEPNLQVDLQPINPKIFPRLQKINYVRTFLTEAKYIFDLLRKIPRYDLIHIYSASYYSFWLAPTPAVFISKIFGKKTLLNYKSGEAEDHLKTWRSAVPIIRRFDKIVVPSGYLVDVFAKFGLEANSVFNVVDTENFRFRLRDPLRPVFLSNRNFEPLYNVACTLRAFAIIQKKFPEAVLYVAGDGSEKKNLQMLANELDLKNVEFLGQISLDEMPGLYNKADIYLNSPNIDNMPSSIIEAYAAGTPIVSTNAGGIPYILEHGKTGLLVEINDHENLANEAIRLLENNDLAQELTKNGRELTKKFSWENARLGWLKIYAEMSGNK